VDGPLAKNEGFCLVGGQGFRSRVVVGDVE
jgi:hypothetical protein